jgi:phage tail protein X
VVNGSESVRSRFAGKAAGDRPDALAAYEEGLAIMRKVAAANPGNAQWQRDLAVNLRQVGNVRLAAGDRPGALAAYEEGLAIMRKVAAAHPANAQWQSDLSVDLEIYEYAPEDTGGRGARSRGRTPAQRHLPAPLPLPLAPPVTT